MYKIIEWEASKPLSFIKQIFCFLLFYFLTHVMEYMLHIIVLVQAFYELKNVF
jgi:hypothetical protein